MKLLADVLGVLLAGVAIASLLRLGEAAPLQRTAGVAVVVVAATSVLFFGNAWDAGRAFRASTRAGRAVPKAAAQVAGGSGANVGFLAWARTKIVHGRAAPTFWLAPDAVRNDALAYQWSTYQLLPARETDAPREANWIVLYGVDPAKARYDHAAFRRVTVYAPGLALAERAHGA